MRTKQWNWTGHEKNTGRTVHSARPNPTGTLGYFGPMSQFFNGMDEMFDQTFQALGIPALTRNMGLNNLMFHPHIDISSTDEEYAVHVEVPGLEEKDVRVEVTEDGMLRISGEKRAAKEDRQYHRAERTYGFFERSLSLPEDLEQETVEASFRNGVLTITAQKRQTSSASKPRRIEIGTDDTGRHANRNAGRHEARTEHRPEVANANPKKVA